MTLQCYPAFSTTASTVYTSGLPACPSSSILREVYQKDFNEKITIADGLLLDRWNAHVTIMEGHTDEISGVDYSPANDLVVTSGSEDKTIRLWDARTGERLLVLKQEKGVTSVAFSPDGKDILAGFDNGKLLVSKTILCPRK